MSQPNPALKRLDILVGTWSVKGQESESGGEITGQLTFEWMEGGFFFVQRADVNYPEQKIRGVEIIGYDEQKKVLISHYFDNIGNIFEYLWEVSDSELKIWGGYVGSVASFRGKFSDDKNTIIGRWDWPGGGYEATMTRVK